jgi:hypothetical protein
MSASDPCVISATRRLSGFEGKAEVQGPICRSSSRPSLSSSSICKPRGHSASMCQRRYSHAPTRSSNEAGRLPLLADCGHFAADFQCPLLRVKQTLIGHAPISAFDPKRTWTRAQGRQFDLWRYSIAIANVESHTRRSGVQGEAAGFR